MVAARSWSMDTCVECHRNPAPNLRPLDQVFSMHAPRQANNSDAGKLLAQVYGIDSPAKLTNCSICHR
jgi:hypothetical protein